jgi:lysophospholipase L1-like esterase
MESDPLLGYRLKSDRAGATAFVDSAGRIFARIKPPHTYRIICLGGSDTYGVGADKTHSYPVLLEKWLRLTYGRCGKNFEVINAGLMGYHSWHSRIRADMELAALTPDAYLVMDAVNDLMCAMAIKNEKAFSRERQTVLQLTNIQKPGLLGYLRGFGDYAYNNLALYRVVIHLSEGQTLSSGQEEVARRLRLFGYKENMCHIIARAGSLGASVLLLNYPWKTCNDAAPPIGLYRSAGAYFTAANHELAAETKTPLVDLQPLFNEATRPEGFLDRIYFDEFHFTKAGNALIDQAVAKALPEVPSFQAFTKGCSPASASAVRTMLHPVLYFTNGWPMPPAHLQPLSVVAEEGVVQEAAGPPGWETASATRKGGTAHIRLRVEGPVALAPMSGNGLFNTFFYPRVNAPEDRVRVTDGWGRVLFELHGFSGVGWTGISEKFGLNLPGLVVGETVDIRLEGAAQVWHPKEGLFFTGESLSPGL